MPDGTYWNFPWNKIRLFGMTSTTEHRKIAEGYAWED